MKRVMTAACAALISFVLPAEAAVYKCEMTSRTRDNWVSPTVWVDMRAADTIKVFDSHVYRVMGDAALPVQYEQRGQNRFLMKWTLEDMQGSDGSATLNYRATFDRAAMTLSVSGRVRGYDNNPHGRGNCAKVE